MDQQMVRGKRMIIKLVPASHTTNFMRLSFSILFFYIQRTERTVRITSLYRVVCCIFIDVISFPLKSILSRLRLFFG